VFTRAGTARRTLPVAALVVSLGLLGVWPAGASSEVHRALMQKQRLARTAVHIRAKHHGRVVVLSAIVTRADRVLAEGPGRGQVSNPARWTHVRKQLGRARWAASVRLRVIAAAMTRRMHRLSTRRTAVLSWLDTWGIFRECPIGGPHEIADNFGITVRLPGVPVHRHMGNDVSASTGTPIVAPFDGYASASRGELGGMEVRVHGEHGYIYNAHLSAYGSLGVVRAGDVVGYVGSTGDATAPHDHVEWHPNDGTAVDPYPYLSAACG
jgi:murein DD-endopeptidase MepM/ murein hydrolase activator NlpD